MSPARWIAVCTVLVGVAAAPVARAQSAEDKAAAEALFDEGKRLMESKRYGEACPKLADSQRLDPGVGTLLNLALCYKQNGQTASAWTTYREAAAQARASQQGDREELARNEASALEPQLTRLVIELSPEAKGTSGIEVKRDGATVPQGLWGVPAPVDPGVRSIDVAAPGKKPLHLEAKTEGVGATAKVVIPGLEDGDPSSAPVTLPTTDTGTTTPPAQQDKDPGSGQRLAGLLVGGAGAISAGVGTFFGLLSIAQQKAADEAKTASSRQKHEDDSNSSKTIAFVTLGAGGAALIGGIVLFVTAPRAKKEKSANLLLLPEFGENQLGARLSGSF